MNLSQSAHRVFLFFFFFFGITVHISTLCWKVTEYSPAWLGVLSKMFLTVSRLALKMYFSASLRSFYKLCFKHFGSIFGAHTNLMITSGYYTVSYSNLATMILVHWPYDITDTTNDIKHIYWETFSFNFCNWNGVNVQWL